MHVSVYIVVYFKELVFNGANHFSILKKLENKKGVQRMNIKSANINEK